MGATIEGKGKVFAKEMDGWTSYTLGIRSKKQDGTFVNGYQPVRFKKDVSVENGAYIDFRAFPVVKERTIEGKNRNYIVWQILEFKIAGDDMARPTEDNFTALTNDDIPF